MFVDSDFASAEVCIVADAAKETVFLDAIKLGKDLHEAVASMVFKDTWVSVAEPGCQQLIDGKKCSCKKHNELRKTSKTIVFAILYGSGNQGLAERLNISRTEATELMNRFFMTFPKLQSFLEGKANFGMQNNYVRSLPPTNRIRFFEHPQYESDIASIGRSSRNYSIQETNASILKIALVNLRTIIIKNNYPVRLHLPVHDEILASAHKDFAQQWKVIQEQEMRKAADMFLEPGLLGVETTILEKWTK